MLNRKSFIIAIALLAGPLIVYFVLNAGKQNFRKLPIYGERVPPDGVSTKDTIFYAVPDFWVTDQTGKAVSQANFKNNIYIANFFFASCKDVCPKMNTGFAQVYDKYKEFAEIKFLSFTVDPENDSVPVLATYAKRFNADPKIWHFVTGTKEQIFKAGQGFLVPVSMEDQTIDHSQNLILVDKQQRIRGIYDGLDEQELKRLQDELKVLLYEYHQP